MFDCVEDEKPEHPSYERGGNPTNEDILELVPINGFEPFSSASKSDNGSNDL
jgi:hypothetical protein